MISPLLALLYMCRFLLAWQRWERWLQASVCAYADDLVILCRGTARQALTVTRDLLRRIKLELNEEQTRIVNAREDTFDFLGYTFGPMHSPRTGACYLGQHRPRPAFDDCVRRCTAISVRTTRAWETR